MLNVLNKRCPFGQDRSFKEWDRSENSPHLSLPLGRSKPTFCFHISTLKEDNG